MEPCARLRPLITALALALLVAISCSQSSHAAGPWYVAPGGNDAGSCLSPVAPCATINGAIGKATSGDAIDVAAGMYTGTGNEVVRIDKDIELLGGWDGAFATQNGFSTIDGQGSRRGIVVRASVTAHVSHFVIQNGFDDSDFTHTRAGGIVNEGALTLDNSRVISSTASASDGGAKYNYGTMALNQVTVSDGSSAGIINVGSITLTHSTVHDNAASGILSFGNAIVNESLVAGSGSSGIYNWSGAITLTNSAVSGNSSGGIYSWEGTVILDNSTVSGNSASAGGGICIARNGQLTVNSSTVSDNWAGNYMGGIYVEEGGSATLRNTIVAGNRAAENAPDCGGSIGSAGYDLIGNTTGCAFTPTVGDQTDVSANLGPLVGAPGRPEYHPLLPGSLAINAGNPAGCVGSSGILTTDQRGAARVGRCDIGAYEYVTPGPAAGVYAFGGTPQHAAPRDAYALPFQVAVLDSLGTPVGEATVHFSAPASGASGTFAGTHSYTTTATTAESGIVTAAGFAANATTGSYTVTATAGGVVTPCGFLLANVQWLVSPAGNDSNDCLTPATPCATMNGALGKPEIGWVLGDTIRVASGVYEGTGEEIVLLTKNVKLSGGWDSDFTAQSGTSTLDVWGARQGITVNGGVTAVVERFTIKDGTHGIYNQGTLTLNDCLVTGNGSSGIANVGTCTLNRCEVRGNMTQGCGGGIYSAYGRELTLNHSAVIGNLARDGGGICADGKVALNNSTISGNTASDSGGGYLGGPGTWSNCTISNNTAHTLGGGIYAAGAMTLLRNSILAGNYAEQGPDCAGNVGSAGYNLTGNCGSLSGTGDRVSASAGLFPLLGSPAYHPLVPGSRAIDAGNPAGCVDHSGAPLTADQRGVARVGRCDIGAYEFDPQHDPLSHVWVPVTMRQYGQPKPGSTAR